MAAKSQSQQIEEKKTAAKKGAGKGGEAQDKRDITEWYSDEELDLVPKELADDEIRNKAAEMAKVFEKKCKLEAEKTLAVKSFNDRLRGYDGHLKNLSEQVNSGQMQVERKIKWKFNLKTGTKTKVDAESGKPYGDPVPLKDEERQLPLDVKARTTIGDMAKTGRSIVKAVK